MTRRWFQPPSVSRECGATPARSWRERMRALCVASIAALRRRAAPKLLRLCETVSLGDRRFVAVVQFEQQRFLVGATANSIVLLAQLPPSRSPQLTDAGAHIPSPGVAA